MFSLSHLSHALHGLSGQRLLDLYIALNSAIWISCTAITVNVLHVVLRYQRKIALVKMSATFGLFAIACGSSHLISVIFLSQSNHWLAVGLKIEIALATITAAAGLIFLVPRVRTSMANAQHPPVNHRGSLIASDCSDDSLYILQSVYETGTLVDFRFIFSGDNQARLKSSNQTDLIGKLLYRDCPVGRSDWLYERCKTVVESGKVFTEEVSTAAGILNASWLRYRLVKFNDGVAVSIT